MFSLFKKELNTFFGSITGYLVVGIFLLTTSLFLWVIPGNFNLIDGQRASLKGFFEIAPWLYLFLIPAITMRMFAEEKRTGTIEMLITRPITMWGIIFAKFLASLALVAISLIPTLLYFWSVSRLGNPVGNIDSGATWGSFIGLLFLASVYVAIGLFASSLSSNQIISFLVAIALSYVCYLGFGFLATSGLGAGLQTFFTRLGIDDHYQSISRGVVDSRDLFFFLIASFLFLFLIRLVLLKQKVSIKLGIATVLFFAASTILITNRIFRIDLTSGKRYSLSDISKEILKNQKEIISIEIYLTGKLPAGMKDFQEDIIDKIEDIDAYSPKRVFYRQQDVYAITSEKERNKFINKLVDSGIQPVNLGHKTTEGLSTKEIFPGVIIRCGDRSVALNLLKNNSLLSADENLQQSIELLEYEFINAIRHLQQTSKPRLAFLRGQGEANEYETGDLRYSLFGNYEVVNRSAQELKNDDSTKILIVGDPSERFNEQDKLMIDQYIMKGGAVLWCVDPVFASIDSLSKGFSTIAFERDLNLRDQLFRYGVRLNADLLQDVVCMEYPVNTAPAGQSTNFVPAPFYFSPLATPVQNNPLSRNINNVMVEFPSSLEVVGDDQKHKATNLLTTSPYARSVETPLEVSLLSATTPPDRRYFNQPNIPI
ncbi:MAG TPA: gliding motility-associated ABC transporter permease subunit GldF, partial [Prolixibacteraceae bacterium]|nr:gliding motility-associated ABC transporter permease subunit GldF [Prolixibacteraceae bacterium]